jgi:hypothetical protein
MEEEGKFRVTKFNGQNYHLWKMKMEDYIYHNNMFLALGGITKNPMTMKDDSWEVLDKNPLGRI